MKRLTAVLLALLLSVSAWAQFAAVQTKTNYAATASSMTVTLDAAPTAGNLVKVGVYYYSGGASGSTISSLTDGNGNAYTVATGSPTTYNASIGQGFIAYRLSAPANAHATLTLTFADAFQYAGMWVIEESSGGSVVAGTLYKASGTGTAINGPTVEVTGTNRSAFVISLSAGNVLSVDAPWTAIGASNIFGHWAGYDLDVDSNQANAATNQNAAWVGIGMSFYEGATTYPVTYNANGADGGTVPVDASSPYEAAATVTVKANTGALTRTEGTFNGWNTAADGSGTAYAATGAVTFAMPASAVVLYAQWVMNTFTVTYDANGATGGTVPTDASSPYDYGATVTTADNTGTLVKTGLTFAGWNTAANGSGTARAVASQWAMPAANTVLYAQWTSAATYTVTYDGNGNTGGTVPVDASSPYLFNALVTVAANTGALVKTGNTFFGWNTAANGTGINYDPAATFNIGAANVVLYARWQATVTGTYYVDFVGGSDSNAGTSTVTAWKHAPGDGNATGVAAGTSLAAGNQVIFKGGVQYNGMMTFGWSGTDGARIVYDGNSAGTWGTGRAIIDGQDTRQHAFVTYTVRNYNTVRGFLIRNMTSHGVYVYIGTTMSGLRIQDNEIIPDGNGDGIQTIGPVQLHATGNEIHGGNVDGIKGQLANGSIIEHNQIYDFASVVNHGDGVQIHGIDANAYIILRYNLFYSCTQNIYLNAWAGPGGSFDVYGNVVYRPNPAGSAPDYNGIVVDPQNASSPFNTVRVYNNTLVDLNSGSGGISGPGRGVIGTFIVKNNLFYNSLSTLYPNNVTSFSRDYNLWSSAAKAAEETNGIYWSGGTALFADHAARNYRLAVNTTPGADLGASYNVDYDGETRLNWNPGAFDFQDAVGATYSVVYDANGATSGTVPVDASSPYSETDVATVKANTGALARVGYTLNGWNTEAAGTGDAYDATGVDTLVIGTANVVLYAQWVINAHTVTYDANGADSGVAPTDGNSPYNYGANVTTAGNTGNLVKANRTFGGWNTLANGTGTTRAPASTWAMGDAAVTLYALWLVDATYPVTYHANGATSGSVPVDGTSPYFQGATVTVKANTGVLARTGHTFNAWNTAADGSGTPRAATGAVTFAMPGAPVVLYAQWTALTYTITYHANGADSGTPPVDASSPYEYADAVAALPNADLVKAGFVFSGWNEAANGSGQAWGVGATRPMPAANLVLYAYWTAIIPPVTTGGTASSGGGMAAIFGSFTVILLALIIGLVYYTCRVQRNILAEIKRKDVNIELAAAHVELKRYIDGQPKPPEISG